VETYRRRKAAQSLRASADTAQTGGAGPHCSGSPLVGPGLIRTVIFVLDEPYPPLGGAALRNWRNILACSQHGPVLVICAAPGEPRTIRLNDRVTIKYYGAGRTWPFPDALASRLGNTLRRAYSFLSGSIRERFLCRAIQRDILPFQPMLAIFEEYKCADFLPSIAGLPIATVYDAHNVEATLQRHFAGRLGIPTRISRAGRTIHRERRLASSVDQIWVCSELERDRAARHLRPIRDLRVVPNTIDPSRYAGAYAENSSAAANDLLHLIFCGSFDYFPNREAADLLIGQIFPRIAGVLPQARLTLVGRHPADGMIEAARRDPRISVTGSVRDPAEHLRHSQICIVPLLRGGGTRLKILEAFASGCPVISTRRGAEGLAVTDGKHLLFAETVEDFVEATKRLWHDTALRKVIIGQAHQLVLAQYSTETGRRDLDQAIHDLANKARRFAPLPDAS
jgi:glycosyltransferase involved in cell wall biosynthesis